MDKTTLVNLLNKLRKPKPKGQLMIQVGEICDFKIAPFDIDVWMGMMRFSPKNCNSKSPTFVMEKYSEFMDFFDGEVNYI